MFELRNPRILVKILFLLITMKSIGQYNIPEKMEWWYESRFGMFIHFGSYSYLGHGEWAFYTENWNKESYHKNVSSHFNPSDFNAETIVTLAKNAGMKYLVITAKHHEGFCMWHTGVESFTDYTGLVPYNLYDYCGFTRDILQELKGECDLQGIKFCLYYSILDWSHSSQTAQNWFSVMSSQTARTDYINDMKQQLIELVDQYHPAVLWFDGDWCSNANPPTLSNWWNNEDAESLYDFLIEMDSTLIINERVKRGFRLGDFECPEQEIPSSPRSRQWETCQTMNYAWGYDEDNEGSYKPAGTLIHELVTVVSRDGNYLLNIGPKGDGSVTDGATSILNSFADWMSIYGKSIYGTTRSPFSAEPSWGKYTKKEGYLYAHIFNWPSDNRLEIPALLNTINRIYLLNDTLTSLSYEISGGNIHIDLPAANPNSINSVLVVDVIGLPEADNMLNEAEINSSDCGISVFPVPVENGIISILQESFHTIDISIYTSTGTLMLQKKAQEQLTQIDMSIFPPGNYLAKISDGMHVFCQHFIKR